jgi:hypothetical protein
VTKLVELGDKFRLTIRLRNSGQIWHQCEAVANVVHDKIFNVSYTLPNGIGTSEAFYRDTLRNCADRFKGMFLFSSAHTYAYELERIADG